MAKGRGKLCYCVHVYDKSGAFPWSGQSSPKWALQYTLRHGVSSSVHKRSLLLHYPLLSKTRWTIPKRTDKSTRNYGNQLNIDDGAVWRATSRSDNQFGFGCSLPQLVRREGLERWLTASTPLTRSRDWKATGAFRRTHDGIVNSPYWRCKGHRWDRCRRR